MGGLAIGPITSPICASSVLIDLAGSPGLSTGKTPPAPGQIKNNGEFSPVSTDEALLRLFERPLERMLDTAALRLTLILQICAKSKREGGEEEENYHHTIS